jgi:hypothetical protein
MVRRIHIYPRTNVTSVIFVFGVGPTFTVFHYLRRPGTITVSTPVKAPDLSDLDMVST